MGLAEYKVRLVPLMQEINGGDLAASITVLCKLGGFVLRHTDFG